MLNNTSFTYHGLKYDVLLKEGHTCTSMIINFAVVGIL